MPLARFRGVHIAESALLDQSATAVADLLERKTAVLGDEEAFTLPAEQLGKRREFGGRYVTVENPSSAKISFFADFADPDEFATFAAANGEITGSSKRNAR